jgi:hypothetical protein
MPTDAALFQAVRAAATAYNTCLADCEESIRTAQADLTAACEAAEAGSLTMTLTSSDGEALRHPIGTMPFSPVLGRIESVTVSRKVDL